MTEPDVIVDGANVCRSPEASLEGLLSSLSTLTEAGHTVFCYCDASLRHDFKGDPTKWRLFESLLKRYPHILQQSPANGEADAFILPHAARTNAKILSNDTFSEHKKRFTWVSDSGRVLRFMIVGGRLSIPTISIDAPIGDLSAEVSRFEALHLGRASQPATAAANSTFVLSGSAASKSIKARLVVLVLDASGSMSNRDEGACATFDEQPKYIHLQRVLRDSLTRLATSNVAESLFVSLVTFAGKATAIGLPEATVGRVKDVLSVVTPDSFDYRCMAAGNGTSLAEALGRARDQIGQVLADPKMQQIAPDWGALVVLITDGQDNVGRDEVLEEAAKLALIRTGLNRGVIRVATVGIGDDCDLELLHQISAQADDSTLRQINMKGIAKHLYRSTPGEPYRLIVHVQATDAKYGDVIRAFIDVASQTIN